MITVFSKSRVYTSATFAFIMIIIGAGSFFMFYSERNALADKAGNHATEDTKVKDMLKIAKFANDNEKLVANISSRFTSATDTVAIIEDVEELGRISGTVTEIHSAEKTKDESGDYLLISTQVAGSWSGVYKFISSIDNLVYKHEISKMSLTEHHDEKQSNSWRLEIEIKVYFVQ